MWDDAANTWDHAANTWKQAFANEAQLALQNNQEFIEFMRKCRIKWNTFRRNEPLDETFAYWLFKDGSSPEATACHCIPID